MDHLPGFQFDRISFWIGFLASSLFWWVLSRIKNWFPLLKDNLKKVQVNLSQNRQIRDDYRYRQYLYQRSQACHIANNLFPLHKVIIEPLMIALPPYVDIYGSSFPDLLVHQIIPFTPDWPELSAQYCYPKIPLSKAALKQANIVIIGHPGCGKTVALADLAANIAMQSIKTGQINDRYPIFIHVLDLDVRQLKSRDPFESLIDAFIASAPSPSKSGLRDLLNQKLLLNKVMLLLDGLDELPSVQFIKYSEFLLSVIKQYPSIQILTTASIDYFDGLLGLGFIPLAMSSWNRQTREEFTEKWSRLWVEEIDPGKHSGDSELIDLIMYWHNKPGNYSTPLNSTLEIWGSLAGDLDGLNTYSPLSAFINRTRGNISRKNLTNLMGEYLREINKQKQDFNFGKFFRKRNPRLINSLLENAILRDYSSGHINFSCPVFSGYLFSLNGTNTYSRELFPDSKWSVTNSCLMFLAHQSKNESWISERLKFYEDDEPLYQNLLQMSRWLRGSQPDSDWRSKGFHALVDLLQNEVLPISQRSKFLSAFVLSGDPSSGTLFRIMLTSTSTETRLLGTVGCGALGEAKYVNDLKSRLSDSSQIVRNAACFALGAIGNPNAVTMLKELIQTADEGMRQSIAEAFSTIAIPGHQILRECVESDDLILRRAAVYGIAQIHEEWAVSLLEKLSLEDSQWIVRNSASHLIDILKNQHPFIPSPLPELSNVSWIISFASNIGIGITPGETQDPILVEALKNGSNDEQLAALDYLRMNPVGENIIAIIPFLKNQKGILQDAAYYSLWCMENSKNN